MVKVTQEDRDAADEICNPKDDPHIHNILCKKFAAHRIATIEECAKVAEKMREENKTLRRWSFNHIDALLLYVSYPEDSHVKEAVEFANIIADGRKLRMAHLQGSGWHPARITLWQAKD